MNNLLRTLTQSAVKPGLPETDLRLLLTAVKDTRKSQGERLADEFHDALENLLLDVRTITPDNHDAEPFLNRVSKTEAPDYYDIIQHPMDLGTMLRRVKGKHYRSKREFKDDLDLIWANCLAYNHAPDHPLRAKALRLQSKAETLLNAITDKRERTDPFIPHSLAGAVASASGAGPAALTAPVPKAPGLSRRPTTTSVARPAKPSAPAELAFPDTPALTRTPAGMAAFLALDAELAAEPGPGPSSAAHLAERLRAHLPPVASDEDGDDLSAGEDATPPGGKRKLNGAARPRKRSRLTPTADADPAELWWAAARSPGLLANGVPAIPHAAGSAPSPRPPKRRSKEKPKPRALLSLMGANIRAAKRVRRAHARLAALADDDVPPAAAEDEPGLELDRVDDAPWRPGGGAPGDALRWAGGRVVEHAGFQGASARALDALGSVAGEYLMNAGRTLRFLADKYGGAMPPEEMVLHALFEAGVPDVRDLERYIQEDVVRHGVRMGELEKKLVTAYNDTAQALAGDLGDDDGADDEDAWMLGGALADDDFLRLGELGIAAELGLPSLAVPRRLLRARRAAAAADADAVPQERLPYPPPRPLEPLRAGEVPAQIGLFRPFLEGRFAALAAAAAAPPVPAVVLTAPPPAGAPVLSGPPALAPPVLMGPRPLTGQILSGPPPLAPPMLNGLPPAPVTAALPTPALLPPPPPPVPAPVDPATLVLVDEPPPPARCKLGALGQVAKAGASGGGGGGGGKKKARPKPPVAEAKAPATDEAAAPAPKKKKGGGKKKAEAQKSVTGGSVS